MKPLRLARRRREMAGLNLAPFIDMVFLLVIFLLVTTSFFHETILPVQRPTASTAQEAEQPALALALTADGRVLLDERVLDQGQLRLAVFLAMKTDPQGLILLAADSEAPTGRVVEVLDICRAAGASNLSLAARRP